MLNSLFAFKRMKQTNTQLSYCFFSGGGILLDLAGHRYDGVGLYQPLINGIGGNLVSVQSSRISTALHKDSEKGVLPNDGKVCESPWSVFASPGVNFILLCRVIMFHNTLCIQFRC